MSTEFYGIEWNGLGAIGGRFGDGPWTSVRTGLVGLAVVLLAGGGGWTLLLSGHTSHIATRTGNTVPIALAAVAEPAPSPIAIALQNEPLTGPPIVTEPTSPVEGLRISSQHWRRGGLGSNALVTFTLRNANRYAIKDIELFCAFSRRDGSHLTDRTRVVHETVRSRSRRVFRHVHVGFVNVNADRARCSLIGASRA
ncbi:MAG TPA: hypothetical protein VMU69_28410 [Bradyrhizobium sp.]|nr:hypothetical protein [Bradyrhizobium sp.]